MVGRVLYNDKCHWRVHGNHVLPSLQVLATRFTPPKNLPSRTYVFRQPKKAVVKVIAEGLTLVVNMCGVSMPMRDCLCG